MTCGQLPECIEVGGLVVGGFDQHDSIWQSDEWAESIPLLRSVAKGGCQAGILTCRRRARAIGNNL